MALQSFWTGSTGPYLYEDTDVYPDAETHVPFYGPQVKIAESATESMHVVRLQEHNLTLSTLDSVITSSGSGTSGLSVVDSEIKSSVDTEVLDRSNADSQLQSVSDSIVSKMDSSGDGSQSMGLVVNLKPVVNIEPNKLDIFAKSSGAAPDASNPIGIAIPDGNGYTQRTRSAAVASGTGQIIMADAANYWAKGSSDALLKNAYLYAIWSTADAGIVWALGGYSGFKAVPTTTTATDDDYFLLEASSTYTRQATDYCVCVAKIRYQYDTADTPDHTISASGEDSPEAAWNPRSDYGMTINLAADVTSAGNIAEQAVISKVVRQSGFYDIFVGIDAYAPNTATDLRAHIRVGSGTYGSAVSWGQSVMNQAATALVNRVSVTREARHVWVAAGSTIHAGGSVSAGSGGCAIWGVWAGDPRSYMTFRRAD